MRIFSHWRTAVIALSVILLTLSIAACGGGEEDRDDLPTATADGETSAATSPTVEAVGGTPASAPSTATPHAEPPSTSAVTLDDYIRNVCGETVTGVGSWEEGDSLRELSEGLGFVSEQMSALEPPAEVSEWHNAQISFVEAFKETIDNFLEDPGDRTEEEFLVSMFSTLGPHFESDERAVAGMDAETRSRMAAAGCIYYETVGAIPSEDTGPAQPESEEIRPGSIVAGSLDEPEETDRFHLRADAGEYYLIEVTWEDMPRVRLSLFQPPGYNWTFDSEISPISERWRPDVSGTVSISVSAWDATGAYSLSISADSSPGIPANVRVSWEGSGAMLTWDPVPGAEYYNVYHDDFSRARCSIEQDGNPSRCQNLASNVTETSYLHTSPSTDDNSYWVAACSSEGCSEVDTENPATLTIDQPGGPISGGPCRKVLDMNPGDSCTVNTPGGQTGPSIFEVRDGEACYGDICGEESIVLEEFLAYANFDGSWFINRLPEGAPGGGTATPSPAPTREKD